MLDLKGPYEAGDTVQFTWVSTVAPSSVPSFAVYNNSGVLVASETGQQSASTAFYAFYTMTDSPGLWFMGEWVASHTVASSLRPFVERFRFKTEKTLAEPGGG